MKPALFFVTTLTIASFAAAQSPAPADPAHAVVTPIDSVQNFIPAVGPEDAGAPRDAVDRSQHDRLMKLYQCFKGITPTNQGIDQFAIVSPKSLKLENGKLLGTVLRIQPKSSPNNILVANNFEIKVPDQSTQVELDARRSFEFGGDVLKNLGRDRRKKFVKTEQAKDKETQLAQIEVFEDWLANDLASSGLARAGECPISVRTKASVLKAQRSRPERVQKEIGSTLSIFFKR